MIVCSYISVLPKMAYTMLSAVRPVFSCRCSNSAWLRNSIVACADAESLTALLRQRGLAIELSLEEASLLRDCALESRNPNDPCDPSALPKLVGTASTAMPSDNPSRQNSESALAACDFKEALTMEGVAKMLGAEKMILFDDLEFGELLSRGEHTTVQKARYKGSGVVVKALHHQAIMYNQAVRMTHYGSPKTTVNFHKQLNKLKIRLHIGLHHIRIVHNDAYNCIMNHTFIIYNVSYYCTQHICHDLSWVINTSVQFMLFVAHC